MHAHNNVSVHRAKTRPSLQDYLLKFGLVLLIALIFTAADAFSATAVPPAPHAQSGLGR